MISLSRGKALTRSEIEGVWLARLKAITEKHPFINVSWTPLVFYPLIGLNTNFGWMSLWEALLVCAVYGLVSSAANMAWHKWRAARGINRDALQVRAVQMMLAWNSATLMAYLVLFVWSGILAITGEGDFTETIQRTLPGLMGSIVLIVVVVAIWGSSLSRALHPEMFAQPDEHGFIDTRGTVNLALVLMAIFMGAGLLVGWFGANANPVERVYGGLFLGIAFFLFFETLSRLYHLTILILGRDPFRDDAI